MGKIHLVNQPIIKMGNQFAGNSLQEEPNLLKNQKRLVSSFDESEISVLDLLPSSTIDENLDETILSKGPPKGLFPKTVFEHIGQYCNTRTFIALSKTNSYYFISMKLSTNPNHKFTIKAGSKIIRPISYVRNLDCSKAHYVHDYTILKFKQLEKLNISRCENITSRSLKVLEGSVKYLDMSNCKSEGFNSLSFKSLKGIEVLKMEGTLLNVTEEAFEYLKGTIHTLNVSECINIPNSVFSVLQGNYLKILDISNLEVDDEVLWNFPELEVLIMSKCNNITHRGILPLKKLKILKISHCKNLTNEVFGENWELLRELYMNGCNQTSFNDLFFERLHNLINLEVLDVRSCDQISQKMMEKLRKRFPKLKE